jgi:hypothetical protein
MAQAAQGLDDAHEACTPAGDPSASSTATSLRTTSSSRRQARARDRLGIASRRASPAPRDEHPRAREVLVHVPEQTRLKSLDRRSDVFSLRTTLWEILTGERLFSHRDPIEASSLYRRAGRRAAAKRPEIRPRSRSR